MTGRTERHARAAERRERTAARTAAGRDAGWRRNLRRLRRGIGKRLLDWFAPTLLRLLARTWRVQLHGDAGLAAMRGDAPLVIVVWHGRMLATMPIAPHKSRGFGVLVSPSDDGSLVTRALARFGYTVIRGSTSRGGTRALRELGDALRSGRAVVLTPDGPRGPRHAMNSGGAWLARDTGCALLTVAVSVDRAWRLRSWDRFTIPKPFAQLRIDYGEPRHVRADASDAELEQLAGALQRELVHAERAGFAALGVADDHGEPPRESPPN